MSSYYVVKACILDGTNLAPGDKLTIEGDGIKRYIARAFSDDGVLRLWTAEDQAYMDAETAAIIAAEDDDPR